MTCFGEVCGELMRPQAKYISGDKVGLRKNHSNSMGYVVKPRLGNAHDVSYILKNGGEYTIDRGLARRSYNPGEGL